jgi:hypothetical protein
LKKRHSPLSPASMFEVPLPPTFNVWSLPIPGSASNCCRPGRYHGLRLRVVRSKGAQAVDGPRRCRRCPREAVHGTYHGRFAAHEDRVGFRGFGRWHLTRRRGSNAQNKRETGTALPVTGGSMVAMVICE